MQYKPHPYKLPTLSWGDTIDTYYSQSVTIDTEAFEWQWEIPYSLFPQLVAAIEERMSLMRPLCKANQSECPMWDFPPYDILKITKVQQIECCKACMLEQAEDRPPPRTSIYVNNPDDNTITVTRRFKCESSGHLKSDYRASP